MQTLLIQSFTIISMNTLSRLILLALLVMTGLFPAASYAENDIKDNDFNPVNTGVTTLSITPDARGSGMGNLGAATDPDMNSQFWNPSKYAFAYSSGAVSYTQLRAHET